MDASCLRVFTLIAIIAFIKFDHAQGQAQNVNPKWDSTSIDVLRTGIREDTEKGTLLTTLVCTDADGDTINYRKTKGTAVRVNFDGSVYLDVELDFEDKDTIGYDLGFACYDVDESFMPIHTTEVELEVDMTVDDANDIAPEFSVNSNEGYTFFVSEASNPGITLQPRIEIIDGDRSSNAELFDLYFICNSEYPDERLDLPETSIATCTRFSISYTQLAEGVYVADITLKGRLDFETRPVYSSKLIAIDNPDDVSLRLSTTINIQIQVNDAQDVDPRFSNLGTSSIVSEGASQGEPVNMVIQAQDGDTGDKRPVKIVMLDDPKDAFSLDESVLIDSEFGIYQSRLRVKNPLDREAIVGAYDFVVKVIELDKVTLEETTATATATYSIQVLDIDDETPTFSQDVYMVNVTEMEFTTQAVQLTGLRMVCTDDDEPQNAQYNVRIVSQTFDDVYSINPGVQFTGTAILFLTINNVRFLDYDFPSYREQTVEIEAVSVGSRPLSSSTTVSISLIDINDNKPVFKQQNYDFRVSESVTDLPHVINTITADDDDSGENGRITYRLEGGTKNKFEIHPVTGVLTLVSRVDFETTPLYVFLVYAEDHGRDAQVSQVQVTVEIMNANDIPPVFEQPIYQTSVDEDQITFFTPINIKAYDTEEGTGTITYRITEGQTNDNAFNLNPTVGTLTLNRKLSYGTDGIYKLKVEASDGGSPALTAVVQVTIQVIDKNNFQPVMNPKTYSDIVSELVAPGTVVARIKCTDDDQGEFGKIAYRISSGAFDNFVIDAQSGVITVNDPQNLDFESQNFYSIKIIGSDGGAPQLFDTATLTIDVTDANNKDPEFDSSIYVATVDEKEPKNFVILTVFARDPDGNKDLFYSIPENSIQARNSAGSLLTNTNRYNYKEALAVDGTSGDLYIKNTLDKEEALEISLIIKVEDLNSETGVQTATTRIAITVTGEVNTDLSFDSIEQIFVNEGSPKGYEITTVVARDPTNQQGIRNYQQIGVISPFFEVLQTTGEVRIKKEIDYENDPRTHRIVIQATADDNFRIVTATVTIKINDDNDNYPVFERTEYTAQIDEDAPPLTRVANIFATDKDTPSFGPIEYTIAGGLESDNFELYKAVRGVDVLIARGVELDYNKRDYYELDIVAMDNPQRTFSNVQLFNSVKLKITVIDKNNHKPEFLEEEGVRKMAVAETAGQGKSVGLIVAFDDDAGVNGEITFDLRPTSDASSARGVQLFNIVPNAGIIVVATDALLGYGGNVYKMEVFARDGGEPFLSNTLPVEIEVLSTENNDGNPIWYRPDNNYVFHAPEETPGYVILDRASSSIFEVSPRTGNGIFFTLSNLSANADSFILDRDTGVLTVKDSLDREVQETYQLLVYAEDTSDPLKIRTGRQIIIRLTDKDDNRPSFTNPNGYAVCGEPIDRPLEVSFEEGIGANEFIYQLSACDPDEDRDIDYFLYDDIDECRLNNARSGLKLERNGTILTKHFIDYEVDHMYIMCVEAVPETNTRRRKRAIDSSTLPDNVAYIIFHIIDINDNGPIFPDDSRSAVMAVDARDLPIIILDASDADGPGFNVPIYSVIDTKFYASGATKPTNPGKAFVMKNNELHPDPPRGHTFQEYARGRFDLTILAEDPVDSSRTDEQEITVYIHERGQAMKVILDMPPGQGVQFGNDIVKDMNDVDSNYAFRYLHVSVHENNDGINSKKTDVCFIAVNRNSHVIQNTFQLISLLARAEFKVVLDNIDYDIADVGKCYPSTSSEEQMKWKDLWWVLVVLAIFMGFCALCFIIIIFFMHRKYRRYMESEKTYLVPQ